MSADTTINDIERFVALGHSQSASNCRKLLTAMQEANARATAAEAREAKLREALTWIAEMTDVEADFDGFSARTKARAALQETANGPD